jgi:hypothetical protein
MESRDLGFWEKYNACLKTGAQVAVTGEDGQCKAAISYTHVFLNEHKASDFLNIECKRILQLGASDGKFIADYKQSHNDWTFVGYDYSKNAVDALLKKGIEAREVDLDAIDKSKDEPRLSYGEQIREDIINPVNIFMIRVLQHLEPSSVILLLFHLIDCAAPGSVFFIANNVDDEEEKKDDLEKKEMTVRTPGYVASFFLPRTDMQVLMVSRVNLKTDELLIIKKI